MILKKIKGPAGKPPSVKCHKVDLMAKFITDDDYFATLKRKKGQTSVKKNQERTKHPKKLRITYLTVKVILNIFLMKHQVMEKTQIVKRKLRLLKTQYKLPGLKSLHQ